MHTRALSPRWLIASLFTLGAASGCVYEGHNNNDGEDPFGGSDGGDEDYWGNRPDDGEDPGENEDPQVTAACLMSPNAAAPGAPVIATLSCNDEINLEGLQDLTFYGDLQVEQTQAANGSVLVALTVDADAAEGPVDAVLHMADGNAQVFADIFWISCDGLAPDDDGSSSGGGCVGGDDGGGSDGGSGSGSGGGSDEGSCD